MYTVIADDITGAAEIAGVCLRFGMKIKFAFPEGIADASPDCDALIIATDTRSESEATACRITEKIAASIDKNAFLFKKTDSALRGHIIPEIKVLLKSTGKKRAFLLAANPETGRIIRDGIYFIDNKLISETSFAFDPDFPAKSANVKEILKMTDENAVFLPDITEISDYKYYATQVANEILPAGSSPFFEAIIEQSGAFAKSCNHSGKFTPKAGKTLMICGSTHENSRKFIRKTKNFEKLELSGTFDADFAVAIAKFENNDRLLIFTDYINKSDVKINEIWKQFPKITKALYDMLPIGNIMIEGGATAYACLRECGFRSLNPVCEHSAGVVTMEVPASKNLQITLKPGSYKWGFE